MFGPDQCGGTRRIHAILSHAGKNYLVQPDIDLNLDQFTHIYTFVLKPDNTVEVLVDGESKFTGAIEEKWEILPPKKINDPAQSKPADWEDNSQIDDPEDHKPEGWDAIPETIVDPEAKKPDDWDTELDGEWEAPTIPNPEFKGAWKAKRIENPKYKGDWTHPQIDNPEYKPDATLYQYKSFGAVGLEVWQVKSGTIFDNILVTDSEEEAAEARKEVLGRKDNESKLQAEEAKAESDKAAATATEKDEDKEDEEKSDL